MKAFSPHRALFWGLLAGGLAATGCAAEKKPVATPASTENTKPSSSAESPVGLWMEVDSVRSLRSSSSLPGAACEAAEDERAPHDTVIEVRPDQHVYSFRNGGLMLRWNGQAHDWVEADPAQPKAFRLRVQGDTLSLVTAGQRSLFGELSRSRLWHYQKVSKEEAQAHFRLQSECAARGLAPGSARVTFRFDHQAKALEWNNAERGHSVQCRGHRDSWDVRADAEDFRFSLEGKQAQFGRPQTVSLRDVSGSYVAVPIPGHEWADGTCTLRVKSWDPPMRARLDCEAAHLKDKNTGELREVEIHASLVCPQ